MGNIGGFIQRTEISKKRMLDGTVEVFEKGSGSRMMFKRTAYEYRKQYTIFRDKESLLYTMVDYFFDTVKDRKRNMENDQIGTDEKLIMLLVALPETSRDIDLAIIRSER